MTFNSVHIFIKDEEGLNLFSIYFSFNGGQLVGLSSLRNQEGSDESVIKIKKQLLCDEQPFLSAHIFYNTKLLRRHAQLNELPLSVSRMGVFHHRD